MPGEAAAERWQTSRLTTAPLGSGEGITTTCSRSRHKNHPSEEPTETTSVQPIVTQLTSYIAANGSATFNIQWLASDSGYNEYTVAFTCDPDDPSVDESASSVGGDCWKDCPGRSRADTAQQTLLACVQCAIVRKCRPRPLLGT